MDGLPISPFEIVIFLLVLGTVAITFLINRTRRGTNREIKLDIEVILIVCTIFSVAVVALWRTGILQKEPLSAVILFILLINTSILTLDFRSDRNSLTMMLHLADRFKAEVAGLGNISFFSTKDETFSQLVSLTNNTKEKLMASRFSTGDISTESEYWNAIKKRAYDPHTTSLRIHCLAHASTTAVNGVCKLVNEFAGATNFWLGIAFFNNSFEVIISDDKDCVFCFHDLEMTIKNGFHVDGTKPSNRDIVANMGDTFRRMLEECYIVIDFARFVRTPEEAQRICDHLRSVHDDFVNGIIPTPVAHHKKEEFMTNLVKV
ncbi:MAG: hypothetical protein ACYDDT_02570 [Sulfuricella sp.]